MPSDVGTEEPGTYPSIVTSQVLETTFSQRTATLSALDGMVAAIKDVFYLLYLLFC
jgi:hypothetical protein